MKLEPNVNGSPLVTPLKISATLGGQKVEPAIPQVPPPPETPKSENEEDFDQFPEADEDLDDGNGSGCVKTENGSEFSAETKPFAKVDESVDNETGETEESTGKKKSVRKKRSLNWEEAERGLLVEIIKPKVEFVENKSVDAKSIKSKRLAWLHVTKHFNALNFRHRSMEQIQVQWRSMKNSAKKEYQLKNPKSTNMLEGLPMLEFMEEMLKEPAIGGTRSQTRNSAIQIKKELLDDLDEEDDTPLAALPATLFNNTSNSEDTQPTSTLALSPSTSAESQNLEFQQIPEPINDVVPVKKRKILPKLKEKPVKEKETKSPGEKPVLGLKIKRQKCETTATMGAEVDNVAPTGVTMAIPITSNLNNANYTTAMENKPVPHATSNLTTPPPSPPASRDEKYKKQLFDLMKRARLAEMDFARKEHEQKLRHEQQEQEIKLRYMRELHEQRIRFALLEHEARMRVYSQASNRTSTTTNETTELPEPTRDTP
ncbi:uncharacterized protein LOC133321414 [Musca vetustissima]|uniref:uncharacterized protein LOC133321414 n=1 Tax=Musca vetustissima TaxID=27455 RepID=UPI002AB729D6|nr:uncharacterized protein LOC133321414 [Musca vetustissima]